MPLFGFLRTSDLQALRSDVGANAASIASNTTSISGTAASIASNTTSISGNAASIASNTTSIASHDTAVADLQANQHCTQLLDGVHVCSVPRPGATVTDLQTTLGSLVQTPGETCMRVDNTFGQYMERKGFGIDRYAGTWKFPEHYVCVEQEKTQQYLDCLLYTSPSPRDGLLSRMPSSA